MTKITVRPYEGSDLKPVLSIWNRALHRDPMTEVRFVRSILADPDYWPGEDSGFFVATMAGKPAGFLRAIIRRWPNDRVGVEPELGYLPVMAVDPARRREGVGTALLDAALAYFKRHKRRRVWACGNSGSAPGYVFPGVDKDAYPAALALMLNAGFVVDHEPVGMLGEIIDFDIAAFHKKAWETGKDVKIETLTPERVTDFFTFLSAAFPGDWNIGARNKIRSGGMGDMLIAIVKNEVIGYCQWDGEHFGPFGVAEKARNKKVGAKLFTEAVKRIRDADGRTVWFNWADPDAARFYERFGLHATRRFAIVRKDLR